MIRLKGRGRNRSARESQEAAPNVSQRELDANWPAIGILTKYSNLIYRSINLPHSLVHPRGSAILERVADQDRYFQIFVPGVYPRVFDPEWCAQWGTTSGYVLE